MIVEAALAGGDAAAGEKIFKKCKACHMIGEGAKSRTGPPLNDMVGAEVGDLEGFKYSKGMVALAEEDTVWTIENLNALFLKPRDFIEKTKMSFAGLKDEEDRANLIAYLATFTTVEADD
ncbi:MAG: c-type cytochrome [Rhodobacteraceae bacterium]|nr:c-type cytochrome [Paracoccaceae bacterium]